MKERLLSLINSCSNEEIGIISASLIELADSGNVSNNKDISFDFSLLINKKLWSNNPEIEIPEEKKFQNKIHPKQKTVYDVILILDKEWEVVQLKGIYKNQWFEEKGEKPIGKVIAWK